MIRFALRSLLGRPVRTALTAMAVLLGVAMIAGTYVYTDTIHRAFDHIFSDAARGADAVISGRSDNRGLTQPPSIPQALVDRVARLPDVARAEGQISDTAALVGSDGRIVKVGGAPTLAVSYLHSPFRAVNVTRGRPPRGPNEVAVDEETAASQRLKLGQVVDVATQRPRHAFTVVGLVRFGDASLGGATFVVFDLPTAQRLFLKRKAVDSISIAARPGVAPNRLARELAPLLPADLQVRTAAQQVRHDVTQVKRQLSFLTDALLVFGYIAIFVGAFVIFNTFSITIAQRRREFALLRTMGASRRQVLATVVTEAVALGLIASGAGLALGLGAASAIRALFVAASVKLPTTAAVLQSRTVVVSLVVGTLVTVLASLAPAVRATRVAPMAALREDAAVVGAGRRRVTTAAGVLAAVAGGAIAVLALSGGALGLLAVGAVMLVLGIALLASWLVPGAARVAAWPLERATALVGRLARENAVRNPGRTATTAAALMVGLGLVLFVTVFANGLRVSIHRLIARSFSGDLAIVHQDGFSPIPQGTARAVATVPGVQLVSVFRTATSDVSGTGRSSAHGVDLATVTGVYRFQWIQGSDSVLDLMGPDGALVEQRLADSAHLEVGGPLAIRTPSGRRATLRVRGIYRDRGLLDGYTLGRPAFDALFHQKRLAQVLIKLAPGADRARVQQAIGRALRAFPEARVRSQRQLADDETKQINSLLALLYALLAMSLVVSLFGVINALTLSTYERTRELGLLRAVGLSRRGVRRMVRYESVITAALGAALGLGLGLFLAAAVTSSLSDQGIVLAIPWAQLVGVMAFGVVLGVLAAIAPARRAAGVDILLAISHD